MNFMKQNCVTAIYAVVAYIAASKYDVTTTESRSYTSIRSNMG
jgi:hypothetical protein